MCCPKEKRLQWVTLIWAFIAYHLPHYHMQLCNNINFVQLFHIFSTCNDTQNSVCLIEILCVGPTESLEVNMWKVYCLVVFCHVVGWLMKEDPNAEKQWQLIGEECFYAKIIGKLTKNSSKISTWIANVITWGTSKEREKGLNTVRVNNKRPGLIS